MSRPRTACSQWSEPRLRLGAGSAEGLQVSKSNAAGRQTLCMGLCRGSARSGRSRGARRCHQRTVGLGCGQRPCLPRPTQCCPGCCRCHRRCWNDRKEVVTVIPKSISLTDICSSDHRQCSPHHRRSQSGCAGFRHVPSVRPSRHKSRTRYGA